MAQIVQINPRESQGPTYRSLSRPWTSDAMGNSRGIIPIILEFFTFVLEGFNKKWIVVLI